MSTRTWEKRELPGRIDSVKRVNNIQIDSLNK